MVYAGITIGRPDMGNMETQVIQLWPFIGFADLPRLTFMIHDFVQKCIQNKTHLD